MGEAPKINPLAAETIVTIIANDNANGMFTMRSAELQETGAGEVVVIKEVAKRLDLHSSEVK